jgi:C-terminal processing protease CtpA/Prc
MARSRKTRAKTARTATSAGKRSATVQGAVPYKPKMSRAEAVKEIERVSGKAVNLRELREELPVARVKRTGAAAPALSRQRAGRRKISAGGVAEADPDALTRDERLTLIDQAMLMLQEVYAHLPLKRALHAIDPIQRLQLLRLRHDALDERSFQSEILDIFIGLRDLHTNYTLPKRYWPKFAFLPFRIEEYYDENRDRKYLVSWVSPQNTEPRLKPGVEVTHWNGSPIDIAVARNAAREAGSNPEARRARGLEALTLRWLGASLPPDEDWITLTYKAGAKTIESRHEWQVVHQDELPALFGSGGGAKGLTGAGIGLDVKTEMLRRIRKVLFDPPAVRAEAEANARRERGDAPARADVSSMPDVYPRWGTVSTPSGDFGYVRLVTFAPPEGNVDGAVAEFVRILRTLPNRGLILDVRGNGGGYINFGERILQTLTPRAITPEPFHFVTTAFTLKLTESVEWLREWAGPLATALSTGAGFSQGFPLTDPHECNNIGQVYQGPVVLITDAFCYSTTDIFTAGFQDHEIGTILGCHSNTGAGGANVWDHAELLQQLDVSPNPFTALPGEAGLRVAARRSTRVGTRAGVPLEDLGVAPDERYYMTRADLLEHNVDLITKAAQILKGKLAFPLELSAAGRPPLTKLKVTSRNIDRIDIIIDGRPALSKDVKAGAVEITLPNPLKQGSQVLAEGYREGAFVSSARGEV